jgi:predicted nuclease of predicted toxin-antitoxin system
LFYGSPPKLVWLRIGNCTRDDLVNLLLKYELEINALDADPLESVLVLS